jgi:hypothetical protein
MFSFSLAVAAATARDTAILYFICLIISELSSFVLVVAMLNHLDMLNQPAFTRPVFLPTSAIAIGTGEKGFSGSPLFRSAALIRAY